MANEVTPLQRVPQVKLYLDGVKEAIEVRDPTLGEDAEEVLERILFLIPDRGSKWLTIGNVLINTFNIRAVTVDEFLVNLEAA